jgi:hypothetical protein
MDAFIYFYINNSNETLSLPAFVSAFKDDITIDYEPKKIPLNFSKYLPGSSERKLTLSIDVFANNYEQAKSNFKTLSMLNRLLFLLKDSETGNPRKTAILNVLYNNLIIRPNGNPSGAPNKEGLPCYLTTMSQEIQYESGFYTFKKYVFPKLVKVSMTLIPVLKSTGEDSPSWFVDENGTININKSNYKDNYWPYAAPVERAPQQRQSSATTPTGQNNKPPASATQAARRANTDAAAAAGTNTGIPNNLVMVKSEPPQQSYDVNSAYNSVVGGSQADIKPPNASINGGQSLESPSYSFSTKKNPNGTVVTKEEQTMIAKNGKSDNPNYSKAKEELAASRREELEEHKTGVLKLEF